MLSHRILDRLDSAWVRALQQADLRKLAKALESYQSGQSIPDDTADAIAEQVFIACLYNGETQ